MLAARQSIRYLHVKGRRIMVLNRHGKVRRGRRPNPNAVRDSSGRSRGEAAENIMAVALAQPHRAALPVKFRHDALAGHPLGWLRLTGRITPAEYDAGQRYAEIASRYLSAINAPNPDTQPRPGSGRDLSREEYRRRRAAYDQAFESMTTREAKEVARVVVRQLPWRSEAMADLRRGLSALARHFGLTREAKHANGEMRC